MSRCGQVSRRRAREKLDLEKVEAAFGRLETLEDAERRLERLCTWAAAGLLPGAVASAATRSVEVWLKSFETKLSKQTLDEVIARVDQMRAQIKSQQGASSSALVRKAH